MKLGQKGPMLILTEEVVSENFGKQKRGTFAVVVARILQYELYFPLWVLDCSLSAAKAE